MYMYVGSKPKENKEIQGFEYIFDFGDYSTNANST